MKPQKISFVFVFLSFAASACAPDEASLHVVVDSNLQVPDQIDSLAIAVAASRTEAGHFCLPARDEIQLTSADNFPQRLGIDIGDEYNRWAVVQVQGLSSGEMVMVRELRVICPSTSILEVPLFLDESCLRIRCRPDEQCVEGACRSRPDAEIFTESRDVDEGQPCDRSEDADD